MRTRQNPLQDADKIAKVKASKNNTETSELRVDLPVISSEEVEKSKEAEEFVALETINGEP